MAPLLALGVATYANSLTNGFMAEDVWRVEHFQGTPWTWGQVATADWFLGFMPLPYYRPVPLLTLALEFLAWGPSPVGHHLTNLGIHMVNAGLVYGALRSGGLGEGTGALAAILFLVHPIQAEMPSLVSTRSECLYGFFWLSSFVLLVRTGGRGYWLSLLCFALALLSKELAVSFPLVVLPYEACFRWKRRPGRLLAVAARVGPFVAISVVYALARMTLWHPVGFSGLGQVAWVERLIAGGRALACYAWATVLPAHLCGKFAVEYGRPPEGTELVSIVGVLLLLAALVVWACVRSMSVFFWTGWFVAAFAPGSNLLALQRPAGLRYLYVASVGLFAVLSVGLLEAVRGRVGEGARVRPAARAALAALLLLACTLTLDQNATRRDERAAASSLVRVFPDWAMARGVLAKAYEALGELRKARTQVETALSLEPGSPAWLSAPGRALVGEGEFSAAESVLAQALSLRPRDTSARFYRAEALENLGRLDEAVADLTAVERYEPAKIPVLLALARVYYRKGDRASAEAVLSRGVAMFPGRVEPVHHLASFYEHERRYAEAVAAYEVAARLCPESRDFQDKVAALQRIVGTR